MGNASTGRRPLSAPLRISVAICTWNGTKWIGEQLRSILDQTRPVDEIVVVDDASADGTAALVRSSLQQAGVPFRIVENPGNLGSTRSFELAVSLCTGDLVLLSDQDDVWLPGKVETIERCFLVDPGLGWLFSDLDLVDGNLHPMATTMWRRMGFGRRRRKLFSTGRQLEVVLRRPVATGAAMAFRRDLFELVAPYPSDWIHDQWMSTVLCALGIKGLALPIPLVRYRIHSSQQVGDRDASMSAQARRSLATGAERYLAAAARIEALAEFVESKEAPDSKGPALARMQAAHLRARARMRNLPRCGRIPAILTELRAGNYRFSWNLLAPLKDLLLS